MLIGFVTSGIEFNGDTIKTKALGGSETALISMANALTKRGHKVRVFCECPKPGEFDGVQYHHRTQYIVHAASTPFDVVVASRWAQFLAFPSLAGLRVLWNHDVIGKDSELMPLLFQADLLMCLSDYHIDNYCGPRDLDSDDNPHAFKGKIPSVRPHVWKTSNGVDIDLIKANLRPKVPGKLIYTSRPERGLLTLLKEVLPRLLEKKPNLRLHYCRYQLSPNMAVSDHIKAIHAECEHITKQYPSNVVDMGSLTKPQLYQQISSSQLMLYPTSFPEISPVRGDTLIETLSGQVQIKDLVGKKDFQVYSCNSGGDLSISTVRGVFLTRKNAKMVKVTVRPGIGRNARREKHLYLTPDHEVMLLDGTYKAAGTLQKGDRVKAFVRQTNGWQDGYDMIGVTSRQVVPEHRFVMSWNIGRTLSRGEVVHHKDKNTRNCVPENLELTTHSEHRTGHWEHLSEEEYLRTCDKHRAGSRRYIETVSQEEYSKSRKKAGEALWNKIHSMPEDEQKQWFQERISRRTKESLSEAAQKANRRFESSPWRDYDAMYHKYVVEGKSTVEIGKEIGCSAGCVGTWLGRLGIGTRTLSESQLVRLRRQPVSNHVVMSVEPAGPADAYCMEVDPDHNFVANGIFVHNCIGAIEAQACGTPIVTSDDFALSETVGYGGVKIPGNPETNPDYFQQFVEQTLYLLDNKDKYKELCEGGPRYVEEMGYTWDAVAAKWEAKFTQMIEDRFRSNKDGIVREFLRNDDIQTAKIFAAKEGLAHWTEDISKRETSVQVQSPQLEDVRARYEKMLPVFNSLFQLLEFQDSFPTTLLDYRCDDVSFGLAAKKAYPSLTVTLLAKDPESAERLRHHVSVMQMEVEVVEEVPANTTYDAVFLGEQVEEQKNPQSFLEKINKCLTKNGYGIFCSRYGTGKLKLTANHARHWNFDCNDLEAMLSGGKSGWYSLVFHKESDLDNTDIQGHWCVLYKGLEKFGNVDVLSKAKRTRPYQVLDVGMIVKDEEDWLRGCLKSVEPIADNIIIVDQNSQDRTVEIAKEFGAQVIQAEFEDFSQVRNLSRDASKGDWFFWLDADERLVNAAAIRKYLRATIIEGFAIAQRHLMMDLQNSYDLPVRLLRNRPHYRFVGCIHEHCEDTSKGKFDIAITPNLVLSEADLAHYGYLNEAGRRKKCSYRNMQLLIKDVQQNASRGRMLTWILVARDYLNIVKWRYADNKVPLDQESLEYHLVCAAITTHLRIFGDKKSKYYELSDGLYQDALMILGGSGLPYYGRDLPPFQADVGIGGAIGGMDSGKKIAPSRRWFLDEADFLAFMKEKSEDMVQNLGLVKIERQKVDWFLSKPLPELPDPAVLLRSGLNY